MHVRLAVSAPDLVRCLALRRAVFIDEQAVPEVLELDGHDHDALHFICVDDDDEGDDDKRPALGTARLRAIDTDTAKVQRVAVGRQHRRSGVGRLVMQALHDEARKRGHRRIRLSSQVSAIEFYEGLGYVAEGGIYDDAGIPHRDMELSLE